MSPDPLAREERAAPLSIAIVSKADRAGGGASQVAETLAGLLLADGHEVEHFVAWHAHPPKPHVKPLYGTLAPRLISLLHRLSVDGGLPELVPWELAVLLRAVGRFDVVHVHDISSAVSPLTIRVISGRVPVAWTFHDCSPFTGGCLQPVDCVAFRTGCGACPQIGRWPLDGRCGLDFTRFMQSIKRSLARRRCYAAITPSSWMAETAMQSGLLTERPTVINNCVDTETFHPRDRAALRHELGLPADRPLLMVAGCDVFSPFKGTAFALEACRSVRDLRPLLLVVGEARDGDREPFAAVDHRMVGLVRQPSEMARYYAAADAFLCVSVADNFPLTVLEAMASGTAVLGFATGGVPEMVVDGVTGRLVPPRDVDGLSLEVRRAVEAGVLPAWGLAGRARVEERYSCGLFLRRHLELYRGLAQRRARRA